MSDEAARSQWPGVDAGYAFVVPSYQMAAARYEAADNRLNTLLTLASSLTLAAPVFGRAVDAAISLSSGWFILGIVLFFVSMAVGIAGRLRGGIVLPNPGIHYQKSLHHSEWAFKKNAIYFAGLHFDENIRSIAAKGRTATVLTILMSSELLSFVVWIARS